VVAQDERLPGGAAAAPVGGVGVGGAVVAVRRRRAAAAQLPDAHGPIGEACGDLARVAKC